MAYIGIAAGVAVALAASAAPGFAAQRSAQVEADPGREICRSRPAIGSRLKKVRTCMTAQQWEDQELQEKLGMARQQFNGAPGCNADPSPGSPCGDVGIKNGGRDTPW